MDGTVIQMNTDGRYAFRLDAASVMTKTFIILMLIGIAESILCDSRVG